MSPQRLTVFALAFTAWTFAPARAAELDRLLPDNTDLVVSVNLRQILDSGVMKKYVLPEMEPKITSEARKIIGLLGLNPIKDVTSFTVAFPGSGDPSRWVGIIHGTFDVRRLNAAADQFAQSRPDGVAVHVHDQVKVYEDRTPRDQKSVPRFFAAIDQNVLVASPSKECVVEAISRRAGPPGKASQGLVTLVGKQDGKQSIWVAAVASREMKDQLGKKANLEAMAGKMVSFGGGVTLADDVRVSARMHMADANTARELRRQLEAIKAVAVLAISVNEDLKDYGPVLMDVLNSITFSQDQGVLGVDLIVGADLIEKGFQAGKNPAAKVPAGRPR